LRKAGLEKARKHARELKMVGVAVLVFGIIAIITTVLLLGVLIGAERLTEVNLLTMMIIPEVMLIAAGAATLYKAVKIDEALREIVA